MANEVSKKTEAQLPAGYDIDELKKDAAQNPKMEVGDVALPFLAILQGLSPQVNPGHGEYVEGAQASMFLNTVTEEVFEGRNEGLIIIPCYYERKLVEWVHRDKGGGWVAEYSLDNPIAGTTKKDDKNNNVLPNGNVLVETAYHYVLYMHPETSRWHQAVIGMKSTALKKNRQLNNSIATSVIPGTEIQAPRYMFPYMMKTEFESKGENSWWNFKFVKIEEPVEVHVYKAAKEYAELCRAGVVSRSKDEDGSGAKVETPHDPETGEVYENTPV